MYKLQKHTKITKAKRNDVSRWDDRHELKQGQKKEQKIGQTTKNNNKKGMDAFTDTVHIAS